MAPNVMSIHKSATDLSAFAGGRARLWHFSPSHDRLAVELTDARGQTAYLVLTGCSQIHLPVVWIPKRAKVRQETTTRIAFVDEDVRVACEGAILQVKYALE
jgi:hypothetical protein